jgi:hypothetical protein
MTRIYNDIPELRTFVGATVEAGFCNSHERAFIRRGIANEEVKKWYTEALNPISKFMDAVKNESTFAQRIGLTRLCQSYALSIWTELNILTPEEESPLVIEEESNKAVTEESVDLDEVERMLEPTFRTAQEELDIRNKERKEEELDDTVSKKLKSL